jgi:cytochrome c553
MACSSNSALNGFLRGDRGFQTTGYGPGWRFAALRSTIRGHTYVLARRPACNVTRSSTEVFEMRRLIPVVLVLWPAGRELARALASTPDAERGAMLFTQCAQCHGADGGGSTAGAVPRIAGQHYRVLVRQLVDFRHGRRWDMRMEGIAGSHDVIPAPQDIADVAWHVSQLDRDGTRGIGDGEYLEKGAQIYAARCASCHGAEGEGDDAREVPKLAGQHAAYLARQLYDAVDGRRPSLTRTHGRRFKPLALDEVLGLTDYLSRQGWNSARSPGAPRQD